MTQKLIRFAVRRRTNDVWMWTEELGKRKDIEEVFATDPQSALEGNAMPDASQISLSEIHAMSKDQLVKFANVKLGLELDPAEPKDALRDKVKEAIFMRPVKDDVEEVNVDTNKGAKGTGAARTSTRAMSPGQARTKAGA